MASKKTKIQLNQSESLTNTPFENIKITFSEGDYSENEQKNIKTPIQIEKDILKIRLEKKRRGGKKVTVIDGFSCHRKDFIKILLKKIKKSLATGGISFDNSFELQGDQRKKIADFLNKEGFKVKGKLD